MRRMTDRSSHPDRNASGAAARELDLFDLIAFVWTRKLLAVLITVIIFIPLAFLAFVAIKPSYEATSRLLVIQDEEDLTPGAAEACVEKGIALAGIDYISIEKYGNNDFAVHRTLFSADVLILEGIDLLRVSPGRYTLLCLPLKMRGAEASPVRAALLA